MSDAPTFDASGFGDALVRLGWSDTRAAFMLGCSPQQVRRMKVDEVKSSHRAVSEPVARLLQAYLDGYRPADWIGSRLD